MNIRKLKSVFEEVGEDGDFGWMIEQPRYARSLFIFNDNESQFNAFHKGSPSGVSPGAGNAIIRPFQGAKPQRAAGIPTGDSGEGYSQLSPQVTQVIEQAIMYIKQLLASGDYDEVVFSYDSKNDTLGCGIFEAHPTVRKYIFDAIMALS